jgi:hypothetical protein
VRDMEFRNFRFAALASRALEHRLEQGWWSKLGARYPEPSLTHCKTVVTDPIR